MSLMRVLKNKVILFLEDNPDYGETVEEQLDMYQVETVVDFHRALRFLKKHSLDLVILDLSGPGRFDVLKKATSKGIPTIVLTICPVSPGTRNKLLSMGPVFFLPKDKILEITPLVERLIAGVNEDSSQKSFSISDRTFRTLGNSLGNVV